MKNPMFSLIAVNLVSCLGSFFFFARATSQSVPDIRFDTDAQRYADASCIDSILRWSWHKFVMVLNSLIQVQGMRLTIVTNKVTAAIAITVDVSDVAQVDSSRYRTERQRSPIERVACESYNKSDVSRSKSTNTGTSITGGQCRHVHTRRHQWQLLIRARRHRIGRDGRSGIPDECAYRYVCCRIVIGVPPYV